MIRDLPIDVYVGVRRLADVQLQQMDPALTDEVQFTKFAVWPKFNESMSKIEIITTFGHSQ